MGISYLSAIDAADQARLVAMLPELSNLDPARTLALRPLLDGCPERFFSRSAYSILLNWLKQRDASSRVSLQAYLTENNADINSCFHFLRQINSEDWHDAPIRHGGNYGVMRLIDRVVHPAYLRLSEAVLAPLIRIPAYFSRLDRGKGVESLELFNMEKELSTSEFSGCTAHYHPIMRNGIGHGGVTYQQDGICYRDKRGGSEIVGGREVVRIFDELLDTCNGLAVALKAFLLSYKQHGYSLPLELLIEDLRESTRSPWWSVESCIESKVRNGKQLLIYANPESQDELKIRWSATHTAMTAESLAPGYQRYFISMGKSDRTAGFAAFDGSKIEALRISGVDEVHQYVGAFEDVGFLYHCGAATPRLLSQVETYLGIAKAHRNIIRTQVRDSMRLPRVVCRDAEIERRSWRCHLRGNVVILSENNESMSQSIRQHKRRILRKAADFASTALPRFDPARFIPLTFVHVNIFCDDFRRRRMDGFGLGQQLVCTLQLRRTRKVRILDILDSTVEVAGNWRIAWNKEWIANGGVL